MAKSQFFFARTADLGEVQEFRNGWIIAGANHRACHGPDGTPCGVFALIDGTGQARGFGTTLDAALACLRRLDPAAAPEPDAPAPETAQEAPEAPDGPKAPAPKGRARKAPATAPETAPKGRKARAKPVDAPAPDAA